MSTCKNIEVSCGGFERSMLVSISPSRMKNKTKREVGLKLVLGLGIVAGRALIGLRVIKDPV